MTIPNKFHFRFGSNGCRQDELDKEHIHLAENTEDGYTITWAKAWQHNTHWYVCGAYEAQAWLEDGTWAIVDES